MIAPYSSRFFVPGQSLLKSERIAIPNKYTPTEPRLRSNEIIRGVDENDTDSATGS
jgi:hypothetical protein